MTECVAIDDEPIALSIIEEYCRRHGGLHLTTFTSPVEGMAHVERYRPDIVFMDIEMSSHNGLELARRLPAGTCLIFTTAFAEYALEGFDVDAADFLHKPIFYPRFEKAMAKARLWIGARRLTELHDVITLRVEHRNVVVDTSEITYIEAMDNFVKVYRRDKPMVLSQITMKEVTAMLPAGKFMRVHRSFIVGLDHVDCFSNRAVTLRGVDRPVPVGRKYQAEFAGFYKDRTAER